MKTHRFVAVALVFMLAGLPGFAVANEPPNRALVNHDADYTGYMIEKKQQQLEKAEADLAKAKRRSARRQYYAGTESRIEMLRHELADLQSYQSAKAPAEPPVTRSSGN